MVRTESDNPYLLTGVRVMSKALKTYNTVLHSDSKFVHRIP